MNKHILTLLLSLAPLLTFAQKERSDIRQGNKLYEQGKFTESEKKYADALLKNPESAEAAFNLAGAIYKQSRWQDASAAYAELAKAAPTPETLYNLANAELKERKLDEAIENYKQSLRINPNDREAKFNLAYAQKLKQEDENKDKNQDNKDNKDQQDKQDQKDQPQDQDKDKPEDKKEESKPQPKPESRQDAERMLKAIQASEDKTKEKVDAQKVEAATSRSSKSW